MSGKAPGAFRTIGEVSDLLDTPAHVLRFWESRFAQIKPVKRAGGRRYYRPGDVELLAGIKRLLHDDGMTIRGVQKMLQERGVRHVCAMATLAAPASGPMGSAQTPAGAAETETAPTLEAPARSTSTKDRAPTRPATVLRAHTPLDRAHAHNLRARCAALIARLRAAQAAPAPPAA